MRLSEPIEKPGGFWLPDDAQEIFEMGMGRQGNAGCGVLLEKAASIMLPFTIHRTGPINLP